MSDDELSYSEITKILGKPAPKEKIANPFETERAIIRTALANDETQLILFGRMFRLTDLGDLFQIRPVEGFVPMGTFRKAWLDA